MDTPRDERHEAIGRILRRNLDVERLTLAMIEEALMSAARLTRPAPLAQSPR